MADLDEPDAADEAGPVRWHAAIRYRSERSGGKTVEHTMSELTSLHDIVERGEHWDSIICITITRMGGEPITIEEAERR